MEEKFITGEKLMKQWKNESHALMKKITTTTLSGFETFCKELTPYSPAYFKPYECWNSLLRDAHKRAGTKYEHPPWSVERPGDIYESLNEVLFRVTDVEAFEKSNRLKTRNKRISTRHRAACRDVAEQLWERNKNLTIIDVSFSDEFNKALEGCSYADKTYREWIKDLCPNRKGGRRPIKK